MDWMSLSKSNTCAWLAFSLNHSRTDVFRNMAIEWSDILNRMDRVKTRERNMSENLMPSRFRGRFLKILRAKEYFQRVPGASDPWTIR